MLSLPNMQEPRLRLQEVARTMAPVVSVPPPPLMVGAARSVEAATILPPLVAARAVAPLVATACLLPLPRVPAGLPATCTILILLMVPPPLLLLLLLMVLLLLLLLLHAWR